MSTLVLLVLGLMAFALGFWLTKRLQQPGRAQPKLARTSAPVPLDPQMQAALMAQVQALMSQNQAIAALKLVRQQTGWGLAESKNYIDTVARQPGYGSIGGPPQPGLAAEVQRQVEQLVHSNQKLDAIRLVRDHTGWGLKASKEYIDAVARQPGYGSVSGGPPQQGLAAEVQRQVEQLVHSNQKIAAMRLVRDHTGWGLKAAKEYVERFELR